MKRESSRVESVNTTINILIEMIMDFLYRKVFIVSKDQMKIGSVEKASYVLSGVTLSHFI